MPNPHAVVWWIRRDLRLADNPALVAALTHAPTVVPVFVLDPAIHNSPYHRAADKRKAFLFGGLRQFDDDLRARGSRLMVRQGSPPDVFSSLFEETGATAIFAAEDFSPYARKRDALVASRLPLTLVNGLTVYHPSDVVKADGNPYTVFTPFSRAWKRLPVPGEHDLLPAPARLNQPPDIASHALPLPPLFAHFLPGEAHAREALRLFTQSPNAPIYNYADGRNRLDGDGTSALSPYLRFGMISAREVVVAAHRAIDSASNAQALKSAGAWLNELIWREFYNAVLYHFPEVLRHAFRPALRGIAWENDKRAFAVWCEGRTGYPVVDAAMCQLAATGGCTTGRV